METNALTITGRALLIAEISLASWFTMDIFLHAIGYGMLYVKDLSHSIDALLMIVYIVCLAYST